MLSNTGDRREADFSQSRADVSAGWTSGLALVFGLTRGLGAEVVTTSEQESVLGEERASQVWIPHRASH